MTRCSASGPPDHRNWPFVTFTFGDSEGQVYVPPLPPTVDGPQERSAAAIKSATPDMLQRVWSELDYRIDVCRVTRGGHIECVWYHMELYEFMQL